ncbi:MAG: four helix bundle protein [Candidatus Portnoybacteria bacterium RIFCSPHIGHO2_01_FULL_39_19]|nr:MAG: four helix bundle protein [Candidatus Portnoybacteria bacterium RIFCSPHIGHO2_01_FULL_39_19]
MANDQSSPNSENPKQKYDLEERTSKFGKQIIDFANKITKNSITNPLINQLVRAGTSIGANYCEADEAVSKKDFVNKIAIAKKEAKETKYWLKMVSHASPGLSLESDKLWQETQELNLILAAIIRSSKSKF